MHDGFSQRIIGFGFLGKKINIVGFQAIKWIQIPDKPINHFSFHSSHLTAPQDGYYEFTVFHIACNNNYRTHLYVEVNGNMKCSSLSDNGFATGIVL